MNQNELKQDWWYLCYKRPAQFITMMRNIALVKRAHGCECTFPLERFDDAEATLDDLTYKVPDSDGQKWLVEKKGSIFIYGRVPPGAIYLIEDCCPIARDYAKRAGIPIISQEQWEWLTK